MTVAHIVLLILAAILPIVIIGCSIGFLWYFQSEDDKGFTTAVIPKTIVVITLTLAALSLLFLPLDVANANLNKSGQQVFDAKIDYITGILFQVFYGIVALFIVLVIPFTVAYYEAHDPDQPAFKQFLWAIPVACCVLVVFIVAFVIMYVVWPGGTAEIEYTAFQTPGDVAPSTLDDAMKFNFNDCEKCTETSAIMNIDYVSVVIYAIALINVFGWIVFLILGGCGLTALPLELIKSFIFRPKRIRADEYIKLKEELKKKAERMIEVGMKIQQKKEAGELSTSNRKHRALLKDFQLATEKIEEDWNRINTSFYQGGGLVLVVAFKLFLGIVSTILSILWIVQVILWLILPKSVRQPFLNTAFSWLDTNVTEGFPLFGAVGYSIMTFYLLLAVFAGSIKVMSRIPFFSVHPIRAHDTSISSLLFNSALFLIAAVTVNQFVADSFSAYINTTAIDGMFGSIIRNLKIIKYIFYYNIIYIVFLVMALLGCIFCFIFIREKPKEEKDLEATIDRVLRG
jgi:LMBR1 domain-containing protein 1